MNNQIKIIACELATCARSRGLPGAVARRGLPIDEYILYEAGEKIFRSGTCSHPTVLA